MPSRIATCGLAVAALVFCGWLVVAQEDQPEADRLKATLKQIADCVEQADVAALVDFMGESVMLVEGLLGNAEVLSKDEALGVLDELKPMHVDPDTFDVVLMGKAASVRGAGSVTVGGELVSGKMDLLFVQQEGMWVVHAIAMGPTEQEAEE